MVEPGNGPRTDRPVNTGRSLGYWKTNLQYLAILLSVWFIVSFGFGILWVKPLNRLTIGGAPAGFWFAQQGSIYVFVGLILIYVLLMNRLDRRWGFRED